MGITPESPDTVVVERQDITIRTIWGIVKIVVVKAYGMNNMPILLRKCTYRSGTVRTQELPKLANNPHPINQIHER